MSKQNNPFNNFLFSVPGQKSKLTYKEMSVVKNIKKKTNIEVIDVCYNKRLGKMTALDALAKFA